MNTQEAEALASTTFAVMGCAYGNLPALDACLEDARREGCETFLFLGDAIGCCGHSDDVLDRVQENFDVFVAGNLEQQAANEGTGCACGYESDADAKISGNAFEYALQSLGDEHREWIGSWPDRVILRTKAGRFLLCHGSPRRTNEFLYRSTLDRTPWKQWLSEFDVRGFFCAHTGFPWTRQTENGNVLANCGAAGKPDHDGDPAVHYVILSLSQPEQPEVRIRRVTYDHQSWVQTLSREGVDEVYLTPLKEGRWTYGLSQVPEAELAER